MKCINFNFTILGLSETWFNDYTVANYDINGYIKENVYRKDKRGVVVSKSLCSLFADDTMVAPIAETTNKSLSFLASDVKAISKWFFQNKLTIYATKSSTMLIGTSSCITPHHLKNTLGITLDKELSNTDEYCYLGINVDSCLTWEKYIVKLCNKISPIVANLQHLRHFLTYEQINTLYFSYIQPHIDYGLTIWGHCAYRLILKVQRFQNRCARIVTQKSI